MGKVGDAGGNGVSVRCAKKWFWQALTKAPLLGTASQSNLNNVSHDIRNGVVVDRQKRLVQGAASLQAPSKNLFAKRTLSLALALTH